MAATFLPFNRTRLANSPPDYDQAAPPHSTHGSRVRRA